METYLVCEVPDHYKINLKKARRFTEEEKQRFSEWYQEHGFCSLGRGIDLEYLNMNDVFDLLGRKSDGSFIGSENMVFIISQDEWNKLIELNENKRKEKEIKDIEERIKSLQNTISNCEKQKELYTEEDAHKMRISYNNLYNEGGEGYIPHFYTINEYEYAKKELEKLKALI